MKVAQSCLTLCNPTECRPPGSFVHGILQARIQEWVAIFFSRKSVWRLIKKLKIELLYDPVIPLLCIYLEKTLI